MLAILSNNKENVSFVILKYVFIVNCSLLIDVR